MERLTTNRRDRFESTLIVTFSLSSNFALHQCPVKNDKKNPTRKYFKSHQQFSITWTSKELYPHGDMFVPLCWDYADIARFEWRTKCIIHNLVTFLVSLKLLKIVINVTVKLRSNLKSELRRLTLLLVCSFVLFSQLYFQNCT